MRPPVSPNLKRHGDSQQVVQFAFLAIAILFWIAAVLSDGDVMRAETYGEWVVQFPAEYWAGSLVAASTLYLLGVIINGNWPVGSPVLRLIGAGWHTVTLSAFAIGAFTAANGYFVMISSGVFAIVHAWFAALNVCDLWGRRNG